MMGLYNKRLSENLFFRRPFVDFRQGLPVAQHFPPDNADGAENQDFDHAHDEACFPPFGHADIVRTVDDGGMNRKRSGSATS